MRFPVFVVVTSLILTLAACRGSNPEVTVETRPKVDMTAWTALAVGELVNVDGCIRLRDEDDDYALVWTPDISTTVDGYEIRIITGLSRYKPQEIVLQFGDIVRVSGGETTHPNEQLLKTLPASCQGPYWVVGFEIDRVESTDEP